MTAGLDPITRTDSGGTGDVVGPGSSVDLRIAVFDGTTGKLIKDGGATIAEIVAGAGGLVTSVFGRVGAIIAETSDYTWAQINKTTSSLADITTRSAGDLSSGTLLAARMPALTGDVTSSAGSVSTTISNNAVSLAKMADVATASFLGRNTAGTGDPEVLSVATAQTMLGLTGSNSGDVTLAGENYLSIAGQVITANPINLSGTHVTSTLPANKGGTGQPSYTIGDLLYASGTTSLSKLADVATGNALISGGIGVAPSWGKVGLTTHVSGTLPPANGGTGTATVFTSGSVVFAGGSGIYAEDNANLFWNDSTNRLGVGTSAPSERLEVAGNVFINTATANLYLKDVSTGWQSAATTVITPQASNAIRSTSYTSGLVGWNISALGNAEFNNVDVRGAIHAAIITYNAIAATAGTLGVFKSAAKLRTDVTVPSGPTYGTTTVNIDVVDPDGLAHASAQVFAVNDILRLKDGLVGDTWFKVSSASDQTTFWRYVCIIMAGSNNVTYRAGLGVADYGLSGQGFIIQTADQTNSPYLQMATHPATFTSNDAAGTLNVTPRLRIGNLNGSYGYATDVYGFGTGQYGVASNTWITVEATNGIRIGNNTTQLAQWDTAGVITVGQVSSGQSNVQITSGQINLRNNTTTRIRLNSDGSGFLANSSISWDTSGNLTVAGNASLAGWTVNAASISSGTTYVASAFDPPAGQVAWLGKSTTFGPYQGLILRDASNRGISILTGFNNGTNIIYPYIQIQDGTHTRVVVGGLNHPYESDGSTNSVGMKIWNSSGTKLVEFSDVQNIIAGWTIASAKISSTGIDINSGANAGLAFGSTPPTSASAGTGIWLDRTGLYGLSSNQVQVQLDATTGAITAGSGQVTLDSSGISVVVSTTQTGRDYKLTDGGADTLGSVYGLLSGTAFEMHVNSTTNTYDNSLYLESRGNSSQIRLTNTSGTGTLRDRVIINGGIQVYSGSTPPTGGAKGFGTINLTGDIYQNNSAYTNPDYILEQWATGSIEKFADKPGAQAYKGPMGLSSLRRFMQTNLHLPHFGQDVGHGLFSGSDAVLASLEEAYIYILQLEERLKRLELLWRA